MLDHVARWATWVFREATAQLPKINTNPELAKNRSNVLLFAFFFSMGRSVGEGRPECPRDAMSSNPDAMPGPGLAVRAVRYGRLAGAVRARMSIVASSSSRAWAAMVPVSARRCPSQTAVVVHAMGLGRPKAIPLPTVSETDGSVRRVPWCAPRANAPPVPSRPSRSNRARAARWRRSTRPCPRNARQRYRKGAVTLEAAVSGGSKIRQSVCPTRPRIPSGGSTSADLRSRGNHISATQVTPPMDQFPAAEGRTPPAPCPDTNLRSRGSM